MTDSLFSISKHDIKNNIKLLSNYSNVSISNITDKKVIHAYEFIKDLVPILHNYNKYDYLNSYIREQYRPAIINPGTIGAFLFGCFQENYGDTNQECSPLCLNNIENNKIKKPQCDIPIYTQTNSNNKIRFSLINNNKSKHAYVFVESDFIGFTFEEIQLFERNKISTIEVFKTINSKHHRILKITKIQELPIMPINNDSSNPNSNNTNYYVWIFLIIIIMVIIIIYLINSNSNSNSNYNI